MLIKRFTKPNFAEDENVFWVTMTDLLLGLAIIFMTLFVLAMTGFTQSKLQQQATQSQMAQELAKNMQKQNINVQIDKVTGQVKISDLELFDLNSYTLSEKGKRYLDKFIPIYVNTIFSNPKLYNKITNVVIQGHTDSQTYSGITSKEGQFTKNMDLSLKRANAVAEYIFKTGYDKKYTDKLTKTVVVEGKSFIDPILVNGKEDYAKSRRVELKLIVKDTNLQDLLKK
ncbi:MAG: OmpA family protein [Candidatus Gastranaerophilales bacterium]|nr:OmpA family protein [Candidatus Gastranaerophilales bacterium]